MAGALLVLPDSCRWAAEGEVGKLMRRGSFVVLALTTKAPPLCSGEPVMRSIFDVRGLQELRQILTLCHDEYECSLTRWRCSWSTSSSGKPRCAFARWQQRVRWL